MKRKLLLLIAKRRQNGEQTTEILEVMNKLKQQSNEIEDERSILDFIDLELEIKISNLENLKKRTFCNFTYKC